MKDMHVVVLLMSLFSDLKEEIGQARVRLIKDLVTRFEGNKRIGKNMVVDASFAWRPDFSQLDAFTSPHSGSKPLEALKMVVKSFDEAKEGALRKLLVVADRKPRGDVLKQFKDMEKSGTQVVFIAFDGGAGSMFTGQIDELKEDFDVFVIDDLKKAPGDRGEMTTDLISLLQGKTHYFFIK
jgi:hypothetical protein